MNNVVVYNLKKADLTDKMAEKIEEIVKEAIKKVKKEMDSEGLKVRNPSFCFPYDPTVKSDDIPIVIVAEFLYNQSIMDPVEAVGLRDRLARDIWRGVWESMGKRHEKVKIRVSVRFLPELDGYYG